MAKFDEREAFFLGFDKQFAALEHDFDHFGVDDESFEWVGYLKEYQERRRLARIRLGNRFGGGKWSARA